MKSKRTLILVLTTALMISAESVYAKETNNTLTDNAKATAASSQIVTSDKVTALSEKDKTKISQEQAKEIAKKALADYFDFNIDETKFETNVNFNSDYYNGKKRSNWNIGWFNPKEEEQININVSVDGTTGKILNVDKSQYNIKQASQPIATITEEQAKIIGETFLKKINLEQFKETIPFKDKNSIQYYGTSNYGFVYKRTINNIPFEDNQIVVGVDGATGKVTSYRIEWDDGLTVPDANKVIDQKAAEDRFDKNTKMELGYNTYMGKPNGVQESSTKLAYIQDSASPLIVDAVSGEMLTFTGKALESVKTRNITEEQKEDIFKSAKTVQNLQNPISSERAEELIKNKLEELYGKGYELNFINYDEHIYGYKEKGMKVWSANYIKKDADKHRQAEGQIAINALTEEFVRMDKFNFEDKMDEDFSPKVTWEEAYDKAIQFIAKNAPQKIKEINTEQKNYSNQNYMYSDNAYANRYIDFKFNRIVNGIPYYYDGINVTVDTKTGEVRSFNCVWGDKLDLAPAANIIGNDEAKKIFLEGNKPTLTYLLFNKGKNINETDSKIGLVYSISDRFSPSNTVDAATGKLLNIYGENIDNNMDTFKAIIKGSAVEKEALILANQGVIDTKDFKLDGGITRLQLVKILVNAKGFDPYRTGMDKLNFSSGVGEKDSTDYKYLQFAVRYGIIQDSKDEFKGNELVTREELAQSLVKLLDYSKIAEIKGLFNFKYSDSSAVSADKAGYVALAGGLDLLDLNSAGNIRPKDKVTMSEVIKAVYTALGSMKK